MSDVVFDICGTLFASNTTLDFCDFMCTSKHRRLMLRLSRSLLGKVFNKSCAVILSRDFTRWLHLQVLKGLTEAEIAAHAETFVRQVLSTKKIDAAHQLWEKQDPHRRMLISATLAPIAHAIARQLGCQHTLASELHYVQGVFTGQLKSDLLGQKHTIFQGQTLELVVTDNLSDLKLCQLAKSVVIVTQAKHERFWLRQDIHLTQLITL